jgi:hypothetical protein
MYVLATTFCGVLQMAGAVVFVVLQKILNLEMNMPIFDIGFPKQ